MSSNCAPNNRPSWLEPEECARTVPPVADGEVPAPSEADQIDWSGDRQAAMVGQLVEALGRFDRLAAQAIEMLIRAIETSACETTLGAPVEIVLSQTCRAVGFERRTLLKVATTLAKMPATRNAFNQGLISWSQVRAIVTATGRVDVAGRAEIDHLVGELALQHADLEADHLVFEVDLLADQLAARDEREREATPIEDNRTVITPRLDGSGSIHADYDNLHFGPFVESIEQHANRHHPLESVPDPDDDHDSSSVLDDRALTDAHRQAAKVAGRNATRRALSLFELVTGKHANSLTPLDDGDTTGRGSRVPAVTLTCHIDTLLNGALPAWLLSTLAGRMKVNADVARRWVADGAATRLIAVDDVGEVVGVGRRHRFPPGWLRDAVIARDLHDTGPVSTTPGRLCDIDHVVAWTDGGPTDVDNLTLLSRRTNNAKFRGDWHLQRNRDGSRTWTTRHGYQVRQARPAHLPKPPNQPDRPPGPGNPSASGGGKDPPTPRSP